MQAMTVPSKINCLVVDDEPPARRVIKNYIERLPRLHLVAECGNAIDAFNILQEQSIDLIFLDIKMPQLKGIDFIKSLQWPPKIIFTTAFTDYALEGYELNIVDYLVKPIGFERFLKAVNKALPLAEKESSGDETNISQKKEKNRSFFYFRADRKMVKVFLTDIIYIESIKEYVKIVTKNQPIITKTSIISLESMLPADSFIRIHRSFIVSLNEIKSFTSELIEIGKTELPIGKSYRPGVLKILNG
jgi:two-component system, LytTR family, response regulator